MVKTINVGSFPVAPHKYARMKVRVELRTKTWDTPRQTVEHEPISEVVELSITGEASERGRGVFSCGQNSDDLRRVIEEGKPARGWDAEELRRLLDVWDRWHLNTMRAGCAHQDDDVHRRTSGPRYGSAEYRAIIKEQTNKCPERYRWGSAWLVEEIPDDVLNWLRSLDRQGAAR